jgi:hypothetical protein
MKIQFKEKNTNEFEVFDQDIECEIGYVQLFVDDKNWLNKINVFPNDELKKNSIGEKYGPAIIEYLADNYKPFRISLSSKVSHKDPDTRYLTFGGFNLAKTCFVEGILSRQNFAFPFPDELLVYQADRFLDDKLCNIQNICNSINRLMKKLT